LQATQDLKYVWEGHPEFRPIPTYAIIAAHPASTSIPLHKHVPSFDMVGVRKEQVVRVYLHPAVVVGLKVT
jgi:hypothetical protein